MKYDSDDSRITAYVFGELDEKELAEFESHLAASEELQQAVEQTRETLVALEGELGGEPVPSLSGAQREDIERAIAAPNSPPSPPPQAQNFQPTGAASSERAGRGAQFWATIAAIEAVAIALGVALFFPSAFGQRGDDSTALAPSALPIDAQSTGASDDLSAVNARSSRDGSKDVAATEEAMEGMSNSDSGTLAGAFPAEPSGAGGGAADKYGDRPTTESVVTSPQPTTPTNLSRAKPKPAPQPNSLTTGLTRKPAAHPIAPGQAVAGKGMVGVSGLASGGAGLAAPGARGGMPGAGGANGSRNGYAVAPFGSGAAPSTQLARSNLSLSKRNAKVANDSKTLGLGTMYGRGQAGYGGYGAPASNAEKFGLGGVGGGGGGGLGGGGMGGSGPDGGFYYSQPTDEGRGPGMGGDRYERIVENEFLSPWDSPYSTFSIDVDTAAYSKVRMFLMQQNQLPRPDAVRIEELINYFPYSYEPPSGDDNAPPFAARMTVSECPWQPEHRLVRVGIKGKEIDQEQRPASNLVFLLDVSGSMNQPNKLPLLVEGMKMLVNQLGENDSVSIVVYAGSAGMVLKPTNGDNKETILDALTRLRAGGSTNGGAGIKLAYQTAVDNFIKGGVNRVILCTDGDFNVGVTGNDELVRLAETNAKDGVFLTVLAFGMGNHNDAMLEKISNKGNGNYAFIDTHSEARKVLVEQMSSTLVTIAKDVKIQVEFNPELVASYRLIGYENRILAAEDFNDDTKDAGEIGAGHSVTAIYQIVPKEAENKPELSEVDSLKYQRPPKLTKEAQADELLTVKIRYKKPDEDKSVKLEFPLANKVLKFGEADLDFRFTAAVASFGMLLRQSEHKGDASFDAVLEIASEAAKDDEVGYRTEFIEMVKRAKTLTGN